MTTLNAKLNASILLLLALSVSHAQADTRRLINIRDMYPSASPDGQQVVFQSNRTGSDQIFLMSMDGSEIRQLTDMPLGAETPVFSPDGHRIVFGAYVDDDNNDVFTMKTDGSDVRQHTRCESVCTFSSLSPDGKKILYRKVIIAAGLNWELGSIEKNSEIFISDIDGQNELNISNNAAFDGWPVFSPDGQHVAFASNRSGPARTGQVWLMRPDGSELRQISHGPWSHAQPAWSFDGKRIYAYQLKETEEYEFGTVVSIAVSAHPMP